MTDSESKRPLLPEDQFLIISGLSEKALRLYEKDGFIKPAKQSEGTNYYSEESADLARAMMRCQGGRCANLQEAYEIAVEGMSSKKEGRTDAFGEIPEDRSQGNQDAPEIQRTLQD